MSRYEQEIREILEQIEEFLPREQAARKPKKPGFLDRVKGRFSGMRFSYSPGQVFVAGVVLIFLAYFLMPYMRWAAPLVGLAGGLLMALSYFLFMTGRRSHPYQKRWRGQVIDLNERRYSGSWHYWWWRVRRMFGGR